MKKILTTIKESIIERNRARMEYVMELYEDKDVSIAIETAYTVYMGAGQNYIPR